MEALDVLPGLLYDFSMISGTPLPSARGLCAALLAATAIFSSQIYAQSVTTDPVGFITVTVKGGSAASPKLSLVSPTLLNPVSWQGATDASGGVSANTFQVTNAGWTANQFNGTNGSYFVEIVSGTNYGAWSTITATTSTAITTQTDLSSFASSGASIRIRKYTTISDFLGASNTAGLNAANNPSSADEVLIYNGSTPTTYWYYDGSFAGTTAGWYDISYNPAGSVIIGPSQGVVIKRKVAGDISFTVNGSVKTGNTFLPIAQNLNIIGTVSASGLTLATSGLYTGNTSTGVLSGSSPAASDEITIYTGTSQTNYWYYDGSFAGTTAGWYDVGYNPAGTISIPPGTSIVINRKPPSTTFNWVMPSPTSY